jgi:two-component system, response regulator YesN
MVLKAVLFDDEYIVLHGLQKMIDWSKYGIELVGTANNGYAAIDLVETHSPDIIFTDIRMPVCREWMGWRLSKRF